MKRQKVKVTTHRQCQGCSRILTPDNELYKADGTPLGWCGFCKPSSHESPKKKHDVAATKTFDLGKELTVRVGATASRSFRKEIEEPESELRKVAEDHVGKLSEWPAFTRETFAKLYDERRCKPLPEDDVSSFGAQAVGVLERQPEWPLMREAAQAHRSIAAKTSARLSAAVAEAMGVDRLPEGGDGAADPRDVEAMRDSLRQLLEQQGVDPADVDTHPAMANANAQEHVADKVRQQLQANLAVSARQGALQGAMKSVAKDAVEEAEAANALAGMGMGGGPSGTETEGVPEDLIKLVATDPLMLKLIKEIGRMKEAYNASGVAKIGDGNCDVVGVRPDDDVGRLLPFERAKLVLSPSTRREVMSRILQKQAMCWELKGEENRHEGDVVLLVDRSGSMHGQAMVWARALAAVIMSLTVRDGRRVALVMFDHNATGELIDGPAKMADGFRLLSLRPSGGTDVDHALTVAHGMIPDLREPDVIIVSDGDFYLTDKYVSKVKENDGRLFAIMLGGASLKDERFDKIWAPNMDSGDAVSILAEVRR